MIKGFVPKPSKPKVAIVMPVFNAEKFLTKTIQCILDQTYSNWELFAVDDGSTDGSVALLKKFTDPRIKVFTSKDRVKLKADSNGVIVATEKETNGPSHTRNVALDLIRYSGQYEYVAYCDSDDRWKNVHLFIALNHFNEHPDVDMVYSDCDFVLEDATPTATFGVPYHKVFHRDNLLKQNFIYISTVVHKAGCLSIGNFDNWCVPMEDYDMWLRISKEYTIEHISQVTATYMYKKNGSYYTAEESAKSKVRVHLKNAIIGADVNTLQEQLATVKDMKNEIVRSQRYEDAARLRDVEKNIEFRLNALAGPQTIEGWLSIIEGNALAKYSEGKECLEIGSYKGKSANYIAPNAKSLICVDPFRADESGQNQYVDYTTLQTFLKNTNKFKNITPVIGKSQDVYKQFQDGQFEMIFIDGMHDFDSVKSDIENYWPKLKVGGYMCFHDYQKDWNGVIKAVDGYFVKPDSLYDSVAVVQKKNETLNTFSNESETLKEQLENKFLLMKYLNITNEQIDKMNFYEFGELVKSVKSKETVLSSNAGNEPAKEEKKRVIKKVVVICPWSRNLPNGEENPKNFPYWEELVQQMKEAGCFVIQTGVTGEKFVGADEVIFNASFDRLKEILDSADTFISIDSFFPHFAHYHGKHGIVIFSQSDPNIFGYPENLNILKSRDYLRKEQFWLWTQAKYNKDSFISSKVVLDKILETLQLQ